MPRYPLQGISALSQLTIDADKDWAAKGISNLKELALGMSTGDLLVRGAGGVLVKFPPNTANLVLTSAGPGALPVWAPGGTYLNRYFPVTIYSTKTAQVIVPDHSYPKSAPLTSEHKQAYGDAPADMIKRLTPAPTIVDAAAVVVPDYSETPSAPVASQGAGQMLIDGAVADDGGVETDETAQARDATANDMTLLPAAPAVGDAYMLGSRYPVDVFWLNIGTAGAGNWTLVMKYWNGAWTDCVDEIETSAQFMTSGLKYWKHTPQGDWVSHVVQGMDLYWVRIELTNFVNCVTQPLGTQSWWEYFI